MEDTPKPTCKHCEEEMLADLDYPFGYESSIIIKTVRCPKCLWVRMVHTEEELKLWDTMERYKAPKRNASVVGRSNLDYVHNHRGLPGTLVPNKSECDCGGSCGGDCSCGPSKPSGGCGGSCGGCKH